MTIEAGTGTVYFASRAKRRFLTLNGAISAEAKALLREKYPTERSEPEVGDSGWHWSSLPQSDKIFRRLKRFIRARIRERQK